LYELHFYLFKIQSIKVITLDDPYFDINSMYNIDIMYDHHNFFSDESDTDNNEKWFFICQILNLRQFLGVLNFGIFIR
jgi:hypothetical protein